MDHHTCQSKALPWTLIMSKNNNECSVGVRVIEWL